MITYVSSFFASSAGAGPLDWPRGSKAEPENINHTNSSLYNCKGKDTKLASINMSLQECTEVYINKKNAIFLFLLFYVRNTQLYLFLKYTIITF